MNTDRCQEVCDAGDGVPAVLAPREAAALDTADRVPLAVSPALQRLAVQNGLETRDGAILLPVRRYLGAARRLAQAWSQIVPAAIAIGRADRKGGAPAPLTPDLRDARLRRDPPRGVAPALARPKDAQRTRARETTHPRPEALPGYAHREAGAAAGPTRAGSHPAMELPGR